MHVTSKFRVIFDPLTPRYGPIVPRCPYFTIYGPIWPIWPYTTIWPYFKLSWYWNDFCVWKEDMIQVLERLENLDACQSHYQYLWSFRNFWGFGTPFSYTFCHFRRVIKLCRNRETLRLSETENRNEKPLVEIFLLLMQKYENFRKFCQNFAKKCWRQQKGDTFLTFFALFQMLTSWNTFLPSFM